MSVLPRDDLVSPTGCVGVVEAARDEFSILMECDSEWVSFTF